MAIVFFITLFIVLLILVLLFSTIKLKIEKCDFSNNILPKIRFEYYILIELLFLGKIKILKIRINPEKVKQISKNLKLTEKIKNINLNKIKNRIPIKKEIKKIGKKMNIKLEEFHLLLDIGTKDVIVTSAIIAIISSALGIVLAKVVKSYEKEKYHYEILPIYENKNVIKLSLSCILQVKVVHIISIFFTLVKKRKEIKEYERTSNRRSYEYGYEQY